MQGFVLENKLITFDIEPQQALVRTFLESLVSFSYWSTISSTPQNVIGHMT